MPAMADEKTTLSIEANTTVSADGRSASAEDVPFAINDFVRFNTGTAKAYEGIDYGYRFPMLDANSFAVVVTADSAVIYVPATVAESSWFRPAQQSEKGFTGEDDLTPLISMLAALDSAVSSGGTELSASQRQFILTTTTEYQFKGSLIDFGVEVEPEHYYVTIKPVEGTAGSRITEQAESASQTESASQQESGAQPAIDVQFVLSGHMLAASEVTVVPAVSGFASLQEFLHGIDYRPFWVSLRTSAVAMIFVFILGLLAAHLSLKINSKLKGVLDSFFTIPMVLPPTVCGFLLLVMFGNSTAVGRWLIDHGISLVFSWPAAVLAAIVVSFPLMYRTARGAFEALDPALLDAARTLGWKESRIFTRLMLPLAWPSIAAGTVLAFARAMGEFGATLFVAGNYAGVTQTMPIAIYFQWMGGHSDVATFWVFVVILISFIVILFINWYASHTQRFRQGGADLADDSFQLSADEGISALATVGGAGKPKGAKVKADKRR